MPIWGIFNNSIGTVIDIVFEVGKSPNSGNQPLYILVHFKKYTRPTFFTNHPTMIVPIAPVTV